MGLLDEKRYDHAAAEPQWERFWEDEGIYRFDPSSDKPIFSVDTPPPYASASHLHAGHAMSYAQAEIIVRQRRMAGYNVFYPMGFDDNGLPTERFVEEKYDIDKSSMSRPDFIELCLRETKEVTQTYREFWRMLGISVDWTLEYNTIGADAVRIAQSSFLDLWNKGVTVRKEEPVMWDTKLTSTLAQADLDAVERQGLLSYIPFTGEDGSDLVIATTRPELLPACVALFCHPDDGRFKALVGKTATVPLFEQRVPILADPTVDREFGTGLMMVCTFGDAEDVYKWHVHNLETRVVLNEDGSLNELGGPFQGLYSMKARKQILAKLEEDGKILKQEQVSQRVNIGERSKMPVEFIPRLQWFIRLKGFEDEFLKRGEELQWYPEFFHERYVDWVKGLKWDWCISRQRFYGVPIPVWYCGDCGEIIVAQAHELPVYPTTTKPDVGACPKCGSDNIEPEHDVLDTWMTSSLTPQINTLFKLDDEGRWTPTRPDLFPMTVRVQGFEIIRTWLFYTVVKAHFHHDSLPWRDAVISGWGLDQKGQKISKSTGNYEDPGEIAAKYSADALRYWSARGSLGHDLRYNEDEVKNGRRLQVKLFNATKFLAMNLGDDFRRGNEQLELLPVDRWILGEANHAIDECTQFFEKYDYSNALRAAEEFFWRHFCDDYLEMVKLRLRLPDERRTDGPAYSDAEVAAGQGTAFDALLCCVRLFAPYIPFVTEHVFQGFFRNALGDAAPVSIHVDDWPKPFEIDAAEDLAHGRNVKSVLHALRSAKQAQNLSMGKPVAEAVIVGPDDLLASCRVLEREIASTIRAGVVRLENGDVLEGKVILLDA